MKTLKRFFPILLPLLLMAVLMPATAWADENATSQETTSQERELPASSPDDDASGQPAPTADVETPALSGTAHVQNEGDVEAVAIPSGIQLGTTGKSERLEAITIASSDENVTLAYQTHVQNIGWQAAVTDGSAAGTSGQSLRLEAVKIWVQGAQAELYDVYYRAHVQNIGWLDWAMNGESSGSEGYGLRMEALQIVLVARPSSKPAADPANDVDTAYKCPLVTTQAHVQNIGWQGTVNDGETAGTTGQGLRVEALQIKLSDASPYSGSIEYRAHVQNIGWQDWVGDGATSGTTGQGLRVEALELRLSGDIASRYDVYYRTHVANIGWLDWAKNGDPAGSEGLSNAVEALEIQLVAAGAPAPGSTADAFRRPFWQLDFTQVGETTNTRVDVVNLDRILADDSADSVTITGTMSYNDAVTRESSKTVKLANVRGGFYFDFGDYGPFTATATFTKNGSVVGSTSQSVAITASEYNIAPLSATLPVTYFSLSLWDGSPESVDASIPTIVMLDRPAAYDWSSLPANVHGMPYLELGASAHTSDWDAFAAYVGALHELNPNSKFHMYLNDITTSLVQQIIYANRIPQTQCDYVLISDGTATYSLFNDAYDVDDPSAKHEELVSSWESARDYAYANGTVRNDYRGYHASMQSAYAFLCCESNVTWWMARPALFTKGGDVLDSLKLEIYDANANPNGRIVRKNISDLLKAVQNRGEATVQAFKAMYDFNDSYFADAEEQGKKVMVILGTYPEPKLEQHISMVQTLYGDDYLYYYKGHPATPTDLDPAKQALLNRFGVIDIDSSIAAELIIFFNPTIRICGYDSSTFDSTHEYPGMACGLLEAPSEANLENFASRYEQFDWIGTAIDQVADPDVADLAPNSQCIAISFKSDPSYDIGIYDPETKTVSLYKKGEDGYELVKVLTEPIRVEYCAHVQNIGWQDWTRNGALAGTTGQSLWIEAVKIAIANTTLTGSIEYTAHVANLGWLDMVSNGSLGGTESKGLRMEAIRIALTGELAQKYSIQYRAHVANVGWQDWVSDGQIAGTTGQSNAIEGIMIRVVEK